MKHSLIMLALVVLAIAALNYIALKGDNLEEPEPEPMEALP